jgi:SAM-dependent methyltransferase
MWAVLSDPQKRGNLWDAEEFYANGELEINALMRALDERSLRVSTQRCLDFGCGVGRLTQALAGYFDLVDGVDIAQSMIERARRRNKHGDRCEYHVNVRDDLRLFGDGVFDLVYSNIVLQHMDPDLAVRYIAEFMRVLKPGGLAVFQVPSRLVGPPRLEDGSHVAGVSVGERSRPVELKPGEKTVVTVTVRNDSPFAWSSAAPVNAGNHWLNGQGAIIALDDGRTPLGRSLGPGEEVALEIIATAPDLPGRYLLEVDLVEEGVTWFANRGSPTGRFDVLVKRSPAWRRGADRLLRAANHSADDGDNPSERDAAFEMHAVPKERVVDVVTSAGGQIVDIERFDVSGPGWESYRYFTAKAPAT